MLSKYIPHIRPEHELVAYIGDDISVHLYRDSNNRLRLGIQAAKETPIVVEQAPRPIQVAGRRNLW